MRRLLLPLLILASSSAFAGELTREDVVRLTLSEHPAAAASGLRADAARAAAGGEGAVEPLMIDVGLAPGMVTMRPGVQVAVGWTLPLWGMRGLERSAASRRADMAGAAERMTRVELAAAASLAVDDWLLALARLDVLEDQRATMEAAREAIARRVAAGLAPLGAESMARMQVLELEEQRIVAQGELEVAAAVLEALAGVPVARISTAIPPLDVPAGWAEPSSPAVQMATAELAMRSDMVEMARREGRPMITPMVSVNTMWPDPMDWAMVGVGVGVPLDVRAQRARREAAATERLAAASALEAAERDVEQARARAMAMLRMAESMEALMRSRGEPLAVERARLARSAWEADQGLASEWLAAERDVFEARWGIAQARADRSRAVAMITMIDGREIGASEEVP